LNSSIELFERLPNRISFSISMNSDSACQTNCLYEMDGQLTLITLSENLGEVEGILD
jgi:hypothetical protein